MNDSIRRITLELHSVSSKEVVKVRKSDNGRKVFLSLLDGGRPYEVTADCSAALTGVKPDGNKFYRECAVQGYSLSFVIDQQLTAIPGDVPCELKLYGADSKQLTSTSFSVLVEDTLYEQGDDVEDPRAPTRLLLAPQGCKVGQYFRIAAVDENGTAVRLEAVDAPSGGTGDGIAGENGATFTPAVDGSGNLTWTNDRGLANPDPVNIMGPAGPAGATGADGSTGAAGPAGSDGDDGATFTPAVDGSGNLTWTNDRGLANPDPVNIMGPAGPAGAAGADGSAGAAGPAGSDGDDGATFTPAVDASGNLTWTNDRGLVNPDPVNIMGPAGPAGADGMSPYIGENGNWYVGPLDTGISASGASTVTEFYDLVPDGAGPHTVFRGKYLGTYVTDEQYAAIADGTFRGLFIGDYWIINDKIYRIAAFDYYLRTGDTEFTKHHVVIVTDKCIARTTMAASNDTTGAYISSVYYTETRASVLEIVNAAFGAEHIVGNRKQFANAVTNGVESAASWYNASVDLMSERNIFGANIYAFKNCGTNVPMMMTNDATQYPLFALCPSLIFNRDTYFLRDVVSGSKYACVGTVGRTFPADAGASYGVRPTFSIIGD